MIKYLHSIRLLAVLPLLVLSMIAQTVWAQDRAVSGVIKDGSTGEAIPGASILEKGTNNGTISDIDGKYSLSISEDATLVFSFVGYVTEEVEVNDQSVIDLTMMPDIKSLEEIVVVGYGTTMRKDLTTAISKVDPEDVPKAANNSVPQLLFGRAAGLQVSQGSAEPGGNIDLSIRGRGNPLIVVDGVLYPYDELEPDNGSFELQGVNRGGLAGLNPNDIESIEVLKDASASIYGVSAADGVILITTKQGKAGKMSITYDGSRSMIRSMDYLEPLSGAEHMYYFNQFSKEEYLFNNNMEPFGPDTPAGWTATFSREDIENARNTRWLDEVMRTGSIDNHNLTVNGGNENATYYFSGNYFNQQGILKNSGIERYTGRLNVTFNLNDFISLNTNVNASRTFANNPGSGWQTGNAGEESFGALQAALGYPAYLPVRDENGDYTLYGTTGNPVSLQEIQDETNSSKIFANVSLDVDIIQNKLSAKLLYGNNYETALRDFFIPSTTYFDQQFRARASVNENIRQFQTMEGILKYNDNFGDVVDLDVIAGVGQYIDNGRGSGIETADILDAIGTDNLAAATGPKTVTSYRYKNVRRSFFTRGNFDFLDRYVVSLSYRLDGSDKFFPDNKYDGFPSASVGWKISNESFLEGVNFIDLIKVRGSIGVTGRTIGTAAYGVFAPDASIIYFNGTSVSYSPYEQTRQDDPSLGWERTVNKNIGLDFGFFNNRITGSVDVFSDKITNLLTERATNQLSAIPTKFENDGAQVRSGYEVSLSTLNFSKGDFQWKTTINVSNYTYRWDERFENADLQEFVDEKDPVRSIYVFETEGILQVGEEAPSFQPSGAEFPGAPVFVDVNSDDTLNHQDVKMFREDPTLILGLGNTFYYKNFDASIFFYGQFGAWGWNNSLIWSNPNNLISGKQSATTDIRNVWSISNPDGTYPGVAYDESVLGLPASVDTRLASRDFVRCRNITLGYTHTPESVKIIKSIRVYVDVQNPFIFTDYVGADPETEAGDTKGGPAPYPMARTYSLGVNVNF